MKRLFILLIVTCILLFSSNSNARPCTHQFYDNFGEVICLGCGFGGVGLWPIPGTMYRQFFVLCRACGLTCSNNPQVIDPYADKSNDSLAECRIALEEDFEFPFHDVFGDFSIDLQNSIDKIVEFARLDPIQGIYLLGYVKKDQLFLEERRYDRAMVSKDLTYDYFQLALDTLSADNGLDSTTDNEKDTLEQSANLLSAPSYDGTILIESWLSNSVNNTVELRIMTSLVDVDAKNSHTNLEFDVMEILGETWIILEKVYGSESAYNILSISN